MNNNNRLCHNTIPVYYSVFHVQKQQFTSVVRSCELHCLSKASQGYVTECIAIKQLEMRHVVMPLPSELTIQAVQTISS